MTRPVQPSARQLATGVVVALLAGAAVVSGLGRVAGYSDVGDALDGATPQWLVLCVVGQILVFVGYAGVLRSAVDDGVVRLPTAVSIRLALASFAATQIFAFGGVGGLAVVYWALRRVGRDRAGAAVVLIGLNTAVYLVFGVMAWTAAAVAIATDLAPPGMTVPWLVGIPVVLLAARWFTAPSRVAGWTESDGGAMRRALAVGVGAAAWTRARLASGPFIFAWAGCYWVGDVVSLWAALRAFGAEPGIVAVVVAYTTGYLVQALPIPLIATAGVDAATTVLLDAVGVPLELALLGVVAHRVFAFWLPVIPGAIFAVTLPRLDFGSESLLVADE